ncbi:MAG TPA: oligosaccharide flippase family protein [Thermoleophilaceae bacterium]
MPQERAQAPDQSLVDAAFAGVRWVTFARVGAEVVTFAAAIVLARLVGPSEFGRAAVPLVLMPLAVILTFEGFGSALVQREEIGPAHVESATLTSVAAGLLLSLLTLAVAQPIAAPLFGEGMAELLPLAAPAFFIAGLGAVPRALLWRQLDFRRVSLIEVGSLALGAISSVALALAGLDAEALVLGGVVATAASTLMLVIAVPPPLPRWRPRELREITRFGVPASLAGLLYVGISNADYAVLAIRASSAQVGIYWRAFQLGVSYQEKISGIMMRLAFPVYARTGSLDELRRLHARASRVHAAVIVPLLALLVITAPDLVPWVFGERWAPAALPAQILAFAGMIAAILTGYPQVMLAAGKPRALMIFNVGVLAAYCVLVWFAAPHGLTTVAVAVVGIHVSMLFTVYGVLFRNVLGIPLRRLLADIAPGAVSSCALAAAAVPTLGLMHGLGAPTFFELAAVGLVGAAVYLLALRALFPAAWSDLAMLVRRLRPEGFLVRRPVTEPAA